MKAKVDSCDSLPIKKDWLCIMLWYSLNHFFKKIKVNATIIWFKKNARIICLKNNPKIFCDSIIMSRFGEKKIIKERFYGAKKAVKIWDVNFDNIVDLIFG